MHLRTISIRAVLCCLLGVCLSLWGAVAQGQNGTIWTWGANNYGQLGDGTFDTTSPFGKSTPVQVVNLSGMKAIAGGLYHSLAVKQDGTVWAWGYNGRGQLGDRTYTNRNTPVQVQNLSGVTAIAAGEGHSLALKQDGTVWAWGGNSSGQLGDGTYALRNTPAPVLNLSGVKAIAGGESHSLALKQDGTVWAWGNNFNGQLGDGTFDREAPYGSSTPVQVKNLSGVTAIAGGRLHSLAVKQDGTVWAWGYNGGGELGDGTNRNSPTPVQVQNLSGGKAIDGGQYHSLAVKQDGTVWAWGGGVPVNGIFVTTNIPIQIENLSGVTAIAGGVGYSLTLKQDGTVWAWGLNQVGQLGDGTFDTERPYGKPIPVPVQNLLGVTAIAAGEYHGLAISGVPVSIQITTLQGAETNTTLPSNLRLNIGPPKYPPPPSPLYADFNNLTIKKLKVNIKIEGVQQPVDIHCYIEPTAKTGGHEHDNPPRPHGWLLRPQDSLALIPVGPTAKPGTTNYSSAASPLKATTLADGTLTLTYCAPEISGQEKITVAYAAAPANKASATIMVVVPNLTAFSDTNAVSVRAPDTNHTDSVAFYGTANMNQAMAALALNYFQETNTPLPVNDMSLPTGGLFDIAGGWTYGHIGHKAGLECDLGLVPPAVGTIPNTFQLRFMQMLTDQGWWINNPNLWSSEGNHYHINLSPDNGKVTIRGVQRQAPLPNPSVIWSDAEHSKLDLSLELLNRGGLKAETVRVDTIQLLDPSPSGVTLTSLAQTPYDLGAMAIRQTKTLSFQVLVAPTGSNLTSFRLRLTGVATVAGGRTFPFAEEFLARVK